jgi:hypothetical protein
MFLYTRFRWLYELHTSEKATPEQTLNLAFSGIDRTAFPAARHVKVILGRFIT